MMIKTDSNESLWQRLYQPWRQLAMVTALVICTQLTPLTVYAEGEGVNINTATAEQLSAALSGVGMAKAYRIIEYREAHGPFENIDELTDVSGIGNAIIERNRERLRLE